MVVKSTYVVLVSVLVAMTSCKPKSASKVRDSNSDAINRAYAGVSFFTDDMFVPYSNVGYDPAFCAGTSALHALVANRARFHAANPPSLKCPAKFTTADDEAYSAGAWAAIRAEALKPDFTSRSTLHIYAAPTFSAFGAANLTKFASVVNDLQEIAGPLRNLESYWSYVDAQTTQPSTFEDMAASVRKGHFLVVAVHSSGADPSPGVTNTYANLKTDCESRGFVWDSVANLCDYSQNRYAKPNPLTTGDASQTSNPVSPDTPTPQPQTNTTSKNPTPEPSPNNTPNHAIFVVGAYDDDSLLIYTTWTNHISRWQKTFAVPEFNRWYSNPYVIKTIPMLVTENRDSAPDLLQKLNEKYGYTGPKASIACPGDGKKPSANAGAQIIPGPHSGTLPPFNFAVNTRQVGSETYVDVSAITPCPNGNINWVLESTAPVGNGEDVRPDLAVRRWQSSGSITKFSTPLLSRSNRLQITGTCKNLPPFTMPIELPIEDNHGR